MEKAILKTLIYADIFNYPLKINEIHKWLIGKRVTLRQVEKALKKLNHELRIMNNGKYYFLRNRSGLTAQRQRREKQSVIYLRKAKIISGILKVIPWIKLVGISGGLAVNNASKKDDIDLFIVTSKSRLWVSRLLALGLLSLTGQRRKAGESGRKIAGKLCLNILLEEDKLEQRNKDIYVAHEVLQMRPLWYRGGIYSRYLEDNSWVLRFLPNWIATFSHELRIKNHESRLKQENHNSLFMLHDSFMDAIEDLARRFQLWYMRKPKGMERIEDGALYFHPEDCRQKILSEYQRRLKKVSTS